MRAVHSLSSGVVGVALAVAVAACGEEEVAPTADRGVAAPTPAKSGGGGEADDKGDADSQAEGEEKGAVSKRSRPVLTREDFSLATRDPFQNFLGTQVVELEPDRPRAQRDVKMSEYNFEDLNLIAIVHSGRAIVPRALFLASDGKSKTIHQGEYFSRAEVLLAAVNRDYVEVEVVDEDLATSLNMTRGERRAIYLKNE